MLNWPKNIGEMRVWSGDSLVHLKSPDLFEDDVYQDWQCGQQLHTQIDQRFV